MKTQQIVYLPIEKVIADPNQPRQYFDAAKLATLSNSIKRIGIKEPVSVEALPDGKYKLIDGERRYRASLILNLKTIPAIVQSSMTESERLVQQFHVQEQHESWRPQEKAIAIRDIANILKMSLAEIGPILGISSFTMRSYIAFVGLLSQKEMLKQDIPIAYAHTISVNTKYAAKMLLEQENEDMSDEERKLFQLGIIKRIANGEIINPTQVNKIRDSITNEAKKSINDIKSSSKSVNKIFVESNAKDARVYRQYSNQVYALIRRIHEFNRLPSAVTALESDSKLKSLTRSLIKTLQGFSL